MGAGTVGESASLEGAVAGSAAGRAPGAFVRPVSEEQRPRRLLDRTDGGVGLVVAPQGPRPAKRRTVRCLFLLRAGPGGRLGSFPAGALVGTVRVGLSRCRGRGRWTVSSGSRRGTATADHPHLASPGRGSDAKTGGRIGVTVGTLSGRAGSRARITSAVWEGRAASGGVVDEQHIQARQVSERRGVPDARQCGLRGIDTVAGGAGDHDGPHVADPETMGEPNCRDHAAAHDAYHGLPMWRLGRDPLSLRYVDGQAPAWLELRAGLVERGVPPHRRRARVSV